MKRLASFCWMSVLLISAARHASWAQVSENPDPAALLKRSDRYRNGWDSFVLKVRIITYEDGRPDEAHLYQVYQKGTDKTYVEFLSPREKGRQLLMLGDDMWIYLPDTSRPIRITPLERLTGNTSNGDVARTNYSGDYAPAWLRRESVDGVECHLLELTARRRGSTYQKLRYWLRADDAQPVKADFYLASGKHIKSATFDRYMTVAGHALLERMTIYDQVRKDSHSVMQYLNYEPRALPDTMFHQSRAGRF